MTTQAGVHGWWCWWWAFDMAGIALHPDCEMLVDQEAMADSRRDGRCRSLS